jgi:hypothetical protein
MAQASLPLTALSKAQRAQALQRYIIICPALEKKLSQAQVVRTHQLTPSSEQFRVKKYQEKGLAGLAHAGRSDKGSSNELSQNRSFFEKKIGKSRINQSTMFQQV